MSTVLMWSRDKKNAGTLMPLALSRQNMCWSLAKTCKLKMESNSARQVCKLKSDAALQRGTTMTQRSKTARTTPPSPRAVRKRARCGLMRCHWMERLQRSTEYWPQKPGVSRRKPCRESAAAGDSPAASTCKPFPAPAALSSSAMARRPSEQKWSKNWGLVTTPAPGQAICFINSWTTSSEGCCPEQYSSTPRSSSGFMSPPLSLTS
mmetsp:Transcript_91176/g.279112  ORF Transcript_91176/g.279112 Transcript_91176/m.279112 type:complete len:207 (-) Transcript_91176:430-1050(-)